MCSKEFIVYDLDIQINAICPLVAKSDILKTSTRASYLMCLLILHLIKPYRRDK